MNNITLVIEAYVLDAALEEARDGTVQLEVPGTHGELITLVIQGNDGPGAE